MPGVMGSIGNFFSNGGGQAISAGLGGVGEIGNILNGVARNKQINELTSQEKANANLTPEQLSGMVAKATQPLNQNLIQTVDNSVQADVASRGLAEAPGIFAATESQALAPFEQQNQQTALQLIMQKLGLPIQYANAIIGALPQNSNISPILMAMMRQNNNSSSGSGSSNLPPNWLDLIYGGGGSSGSDSSLVDSGLFANPGGGSNA